MNVALRDCTESDESFLYELYRDSRADEMAAWGWSDEQRDSFIRLQYNARHGGYAEQFPEAFDSVILLDGEPVGRILIAESDSEIRLVDIAILSVSRGRGIGTMVIGQMLRQAGKPVRLQVGIFNPARELYSRLGFRTVSENGGSVQMEFDSRFGGPND